MAVLLPSLPPEALPSADEPAAVHRALLPKSMYPTGRQGDAHEVLLAMLAHLESLNDDMRDRVAKVYLKVASDIECLKCGRRSRTTSPLLDVPVSLTRDRVTTIADCFADLTLSETLEGDNAYACSKCDALSTASRRSYVAEFPEYLIVHVLRFKGGRKANDRFAVSLFWGGDRPGSPKYRLVALIVHLGILIGGHYVAYAVASRKEGLWDAETRWHRLDDDAVRTVPESALFAESIERNVYVLVYERCGSM
jgi:ubiquitin C-terminal hydrolase